MIFDKTWRLQRIERKIAGKKAKLEATQGLFSLAKSLPGGFAINLTQLPQEIAELETKAKQLMNPNAMFSGPRPEQN